MPSIVLKGPDDLDHTIPDVEAVRLRTPTGSVTFSPAGLMRNLVDRSIVTLTHLGDTVDLELCVQQIFDHNVADRNIRVGIGDREAVVYRTAVYCTRAVIRIFARLRERLLTD